MITVNVRKQGGAAVITIPSDILRLLNIEVGTMLELDVTKQGFIARPVENKKPVRLTLKELLQGVNAEEANKLRKAAKKPHSGKSVGREL